MNRLDRLTSILVELQSKRLTTARGIAKRVEVTNRTIYRDIQILRLAGVPISEEEGKGYFLVEGYRLPPVMFTMEELRALVTVVYSVFYQYTTTFFLKLSATFLIFFINKEEQLINGFGERILDRHI